MITKLSKILYIFLFSLLVLAIIIYVIKWNIFLDTKIFYLIFLLVLPLIDISIESIKKDFSFWNLSINYEDNWLKYFWLIIIWLVMFSFWAESSTIWIVLFFLFSLLFRLDSRISFIWALILLILTPLYLVIWDKILAESISISAYYFLIIWVILEIRSQIFPETLNKKLDSLEKNEPKNTYSFVDEMLESIWIYINKAKQKILDTKNNILKEIWEIPWEQIQKNPRALEKTNAVTSKVKNIKIKQNLYVKLFTYFIKKIKENTLIITYFLFIINSLLAIGFLEYNFIGSIIAYSFSLLFISYIYSKASWSIYDFSIKKTHNIRSLSSQKLISKTVTIEDAVLHTESISQEEFESISTARSQEKIPSALKKNAYFLNKASIFASLWLVAWYFLMQYFKINESSTTIYIAIFSLFFLAYYLVFSNLDTKLLWRGKSTWNHIWKTIWNFSIKSFLKKHIYLLLNSILILTILTVLWFRTWIFADWYKGYQESVWYENWSLVKEKIKELTRAEKDEKIIEITKKLSLISWEVEIQSLSWSLTSRDKKINKQSNIKISIKEYYTFQNSLKIWSKTGEVIKLEEIMQKLNYFNWIPDRIYDQQTKSALTNLLKKECGWPETTKWILGNQAMQCLYSLEIIK